MERGAAFAGVQASQNVALHGVMFKPRESLLAIHHDGPLRDLDAEPLFERASKADRGLGGVGQHRELLEPDRAFHVLGRDPLGVGFLEDALDGDDLSRAKGAEHDGGFKLGGEQPVGRAEALRGAGRGAREPERVEALAHQVERPVGLAVLEVDPHLHGHDPGFVMSDALLEPRGELTCPESCVRGMAQREGLGHLHGRLARRLELFVGGVVHGVHGRQGVGARLEPVVDVLEEHLRGSHDPRGDVRGGDHEGGAVEVVEDAVVVGDVDGGGGAIARLEPEPISQRAKDRLALSGRLPWLEQLEAQEDAHHGGVRQAGAERRRELLIVLPEHDLDLSGALPVEDLGLRGVGAGGGRRDQPGGSAQERAVGHDDGATHQRGRRPREHQARRLLVESSVREDVHRVVVDADHDLVMPRRR